MEIVSAIIEISRITMPLFTSWLLYLHIKQEDRIKALEKTLNESKEQQSVSEQQEVNELLIGFITDRCKILVEELEENGIKIEKSRFNFTTLDKIKISSFSKESITKITNHNWE